MNLPLVSVCIITYNHEKYIRQCLEGVLMQKTSFSFEIVIGEDCSTDNTRAVIREFEARYPGIIKAVYQEKNVGGARNGYEFCFPLLTAKYIAICEGDDYWTDPDKLQKQVDFLEQNPEYVLCFHRIQSVDANGNMTSAQEATDKTILYNRNDIFHISIPTLSVVFRKCFDAIPPEMFEVQSGDTFLFGLLARYGNAADLGFIGACYRKHNGGVYSHKSLVDQFRQTIESRKLMHRCSAFAKEQKREIRKEIIKRKILYVKYFLKKYELLNSFKIIMA
jgi:glycosyltransferase involved in cell wall biosynthesis